mmetsp:Transcript_37517/g.108381  ORF Transcript_37517/g.108381 Transcript_37517/m.108381 type:complete len:404 (+) Transcript_37517:69-1280(+)
MATALMKPMAATGPRRAGGASADPAQDRVEVVAFLRRAGVEQHAARFLQSGFDDMETVKAAEDADLRDLGLLPVQVARVRRQLLEMRTPRGAYDANHPVVRFLEDVGLGQYVDALMHNGFDDMEILCEVEDADLKDLGMPRGHALKLRKRLREHQLDSYQDSYQVARAPAPLALQSRAGVRTVQQPSPQLRAPQRRSHHLPSAVMRSMPTEQMKSAVERSWEQVQAMGTFAVGEILYRHLFIIMPSAVQLFPSHVRTKYRDWSCDEVADESNVFDSPALRKLFSKFINAVGCAVAGLHDNSKLVAMLLQLGKRHMNYGVHEAHFEALGKAFTLTLREIMGVEFTKEVEDAWAMAYSFMTSIMLQGLRPSSAGHCEVMDCARSATSTVGASESARGAEATEGLE